MPINAAKDVRKPNATVFLFVFVDPLLAEIELNDKVARWGGGRKSRNSVDVPSYFFVVIHTVVED